MKTLPRHLASASTAAAVVLTLAACGGGGVSTSAVASAAGATACDNSGFYLQSQLTGKKSTIYDCILSRKGPACVTYSGGIASNSTTVVQIAFQNSLGASSPSCLRQVGAAQALKARLAAAARARAAAAALAAQANEPWHRGYVRQDSNIYWRWVNGESCASYVTECWHVKVITRNGCPSLLSAQANEYDAVGGTIVGNLIGNANSVPPQTPADVELDSTTSAPYANNVKISCY